MAKSIKVHLTMTDNAGIEWVSVETTEAKAKTLIKQYEQAFSYWISTPRLRATFKPVAA